MIPTAARGQEPWTLEASQRLCRKIALSHYENFTVGSLFLPAPLRPHVYTLYAFARLADDLADESPSAGGALQKLDEWELFLQEALQGRYHHPIFVALHHTIESFSLPVSLFQDLLKAFRQDQTVHRYATFEELLGYCRNSANPVGRLYLHLFHLQSEERFFYADKICTALQLANFWQDVKPDWQRGRIYVPSEDLLRFGVEEAEFAGDRAGTRFREMLRFEVERTEALFREGRKLLPLLPRPVRPNIELFIGGGEAILREIRRRRFDTLSGRPVVGKQQKLRLIAKNLWRRISW